MLLLCFPSWEWIFPGRSSSWRFPMISVASSSAPACPAASWCAGLPTVPSAVSPDHGPDDRVHDDQRRQAVLASVAEVPEVYQPALRLHYWMGASMSEIAEMLDVPENTVKSYLHRARRQLQTQLAERGFYA